MDELFRAWAGGGVVFAIICVFWSIVCTTEARNPRHGSAYRRREARHALAAAAGVLLSVVWPALIVAFVVYQLRGLMRIAEIPTIAERREAKKAERVAQLEREKIELQKTITRLEREELERTA